MKKQDKSQTNQKDVYLFLGVVWRRWGALALMIGLLLATGASALAIYLFQPQYEAKLYFRIIQNLEWIELAKGMGGKEDPSNVLSVLSSEVLCNRVVNDPEVARVTDLRRFDNKARILEEKIAVKSEGRGSELYLLSVASSAPADSALLTQKVWEQFVKEQDQFKTRQTALLLEALDGEIVVLEERLEFLQKEIQKTASEVMNLETVIHFSRQGDISFGRLSELENEKDDNLAAIASAERDIERFKTNLEDTEIPADELQIEVDALPDVVKSESRLRQLLLDADEIGRHYGASHPNKKSIDSLVDNARIDLNKARSVGAEQVKLKKRRNVEELNSDEERDLTRTLEELVHAKDLIAAEIDQELDRIRKYKNAAFSLEKMEEERREEKESWLAMKRRAQQVKLREIAPYSVTRIFVSDESESVALPVEPVEKYPLKLLAVLSLAGLAFPFLLAAAWEFRVRRVSCPEQVNTEVSLIGEIADLPMKINRSRLSHQQVNVFQESVDNVSTYIRTCQNGQCIRSLAVASAVANEGKTTVASQLAFSLSRTSLGKVLLIDCDLRSPTIHRVFEIELEPGIVSVLKGDLDMSEAVVHSHVDHLDILPAGVNRDSPHRLLGQNKLAQLIRQAETEYEFVVLDTPPILAASESLVVASEADATLVCLMRDVSRVDVVNRACQRLLASNVTVMGYVFSGVPLSDYAYRYGGYQYGNTARFLNS